MKKFSSFVSNNFEVKLANNADELNEIYKLRYEELLLCYNQNNSNETGLFIDEYDEQSDHLIVVDLRNGMIAGTYRLVRKEHIENIGSFMTESEFDLTNLKDYDVLELARAVVRKEYRDGITIALLWQGILRYVEAYQIKFLFGTASFHGTDSNLYKHALSKIYHYHLSPLEYRTRAVGNIAHMNLFTKDSINLGLARREMPPLIKGYIKLGATFGENAFLDYDFNSLDVLTLIDIDKLNPKYLHRLLR
jgi:putative hemolysin